MRRRTAAQALAQRSGIVLEGAEGRSIMEVSRRLEVAPDTGHTWWRRFLGGAWELCDDPRLGVPRKITDADVERAVVIAQQETLENEALVDQANGGGHGDVAADRSRIWPDFALVPH